MKPKRRQIGHKNAYRGPIFDSEDNILFSQGNFFPFNLGATHRSRSIQRKMCLPPSTTKGAFNEMIVNGMENKFSPKIQ